MCRDQCSVAIAGCKGGAIGRILLSLCRLDLSASNRSGYSTIVELVAMGRKLVNLYVFGCFYKTLSVFKCVISERGVNTRFSKACMVTRSFILSLTTTTILSNLISDPLNRNKKTSLVVLGMKQK